MPALTDANRPSPSRLPTHNPRAYLLGSAAEVETLGGALRLLENEATLLSLLGRESEADEARRISRLVGSMLAQAMDELDRRTHPIGSRLEARAKGAS